jgi:hypothetical protein
MPRQVREARGYHVAKKDLHQWQFNSGAWRCMKCHDWVNTGDLPEARRRQRCKGTSAAHQAGAMAAKGHVLFRARAGLPFIYCGNCGAWGHKRSRRLASPCGPPVASGIQALSRIAKRQHPLQRRGPKGILLPREGVRTSEWFCATTGRWMPIDGNVDGATHAMNIDDQATDAGVQGHGPAAIPAGPAEGDGLSVRDGRRDDGAGFAAMDAYDVGDEDVFGHGGQLDQPPLDVGGGVRAQHDGSVTMVDNLAMDTTGHAVPTVSSKVRCPLRNAKSIWGRSAGGAVDEAVKRMKAGSRPPSGDAAERIRAVKRRVMERCSLANVGQELSAAAPNVSGMRRRRLGDGESEAEDDSRRSGTRRRVSDEHAAVSSVFVRGGAGAGACGGADGTDDIKPLGDSAMASNARQSDSVGIARVGPGGPPPNHVTGTVTRHFGAVVAEPVVAGGVVATLEGWQLAREADAERGEATCGPPLRCSCAAGWHGGHRRRTAGAEQFILPGTAPRGVRREAAKPASLQLLAENAGKSRGEAEQQRATTD